ncbi:MAG: right-handed parallel beta-helix repeat-containing protein [Nitrococcus sp.]|nr:right-handed parallel beta-helix repeat-containing protein [Nitrococcus sp.]
MSSRSRYLFGHIISLSLIVACGVWHGKSQGAIELMVVDAATDTDLHPLRDGASLDVSKVGSLLSLRAVPSVPGHESVVFVVDGARYQTENLAPYAMAGGWPAREYNAWDLELGAHTLAVNVYDGHNGRGKRIASRRVSFSLVDGKGAAIGLMVVDAATNTDLRPLSDGEKLDVSKLGSALTLRADPSVPGHESVVFVLDGARYQTENLMEYAMAGGWPAGEYNAWDLGLGDHTLDVKVYGGHGGTGNLIASRKVSFSLVDGKVNGKDDGKTEGKDEGKVIDMAASEFSGMGGGIELMVVDAATDTDLHPLRDGDKLDVSKLGSALSLRAAPSVTGHESVVFVLDGEKYQTESLMEYAMAGGWPAGKYNAWDLELGAHSLDVNVYDANGGTGNLIASRSVSFSLVDGKAADEVGDMAANEVGGKEVACNLQQRIVQASPGDVINGRGCVERSALKLRKRLTFKNLTIKGSDDWSGDFTKVGGNYRSSRRVPKLEEPSVTDDSNNRYLCETTDKHQLCSEAEMVFVDGRYLRQVPNGGDPGPGEFAMDGQRRVVLGSNPGKAVVEVVVRQIGIHMYNGSSGTVLDNVIVTQIGNTVGAHGIGTGPAVKSSGQALTVKNSEVSWTHGTALSCGRADCSVINTELHHAGESGMMSYKATSLVFDNNVVHDNCSALPDVQYNDTFACSGLKVHAGNAKRSVTNNEFYRNDHSGIWLDGEADNVLIANNRIHHNEERGIEIEISSDVTIRDNVIYKNGWVGTQSAAFNSGGIYILDGAAVKIHDNVMACNRDGFAFIGGKRKSWNNGIELYDNFIIVDGEDPGKQILTGWLLRGDSVGSYIAHDNRYYYGGEQDNGATRKFQWEKKKYTSLAKFSSTPGEENSRWLSTSEVRAILSANHIPMDCL